MHLPFSLLQLKTLKRANGIIVIIFIIASFWLLCFLFALVS
jgi:hypothetical protein